VGSVAGGLPSYHEPYIFLARLRRATGGNNGASEMEEILSAHIASFAQVSRFTRRSRVCSWPFSFR
jgi:hypothetical protein